ncbi:MAG: hypothetical protein IPH52_21550 [Leptospiraceae bacterium]|nr:hypothetical protein [Leptospiraceae bacterium]
MEIRFCLFALIKVISAVMVWFDKAHQSSFSNPYLVEEYPYLLKNDKK